MESLKERLQQINEQAAAQRKALFDEVYQTRTFPDGSTVRRIRSCEDKPDVMYDEIYGTVVGSDVYVYQWDEQDEGYPNVHYWVRVESPADYKSKQQCVRYGLEMDKAETSGREIPVGV